MVLAGAAVFWQRNRDILSDLYDYSSMITSVGKIAAGLKPYHDFRSTMQSACYALPRLVELVAGSSYAGLTWGGLVLSLGGTVALFLLLRQKYGDLVAALLAGAFSWAGFSQHVVIFYNSLGLLCLSVTVVILADLPRQAVWRSPRTWLLMAALLVGGINKLNFQSLALGIGGLLVLRACLAREITTRVAWGWWGSLLLVGQILPITWELWWTGASVAEWRFNVVTLAEARVGMLPLVLSLKSYLTPTYSLHHHVLFESLHTLGAAGLIALAVIAWQRISTLEAAEPTSRFRVILLRATLLGFVITAGMGGVLLTITNVEIITLTSLGLLVATVGLSSSFDIASLRSTRLVLGASALVWMVVGGYAAWMGGRVLYGRETISREDFVRLENAPATLRYLEGTRLDASLHESLQLVAKELEKIKAQRGDLSRVLFGPTLEWLERDSPESILRGMPVWYDLGTSLVESDTPWLIERIESKKIDRIFLHPSWESWPGDFYPWLNQHFRAIPLGGVVRLYERRDESRSTRPPTVFADDNPLALVDRTGSHIHVRTTRVPVDQPPTFKPSPWGDFFGTQGSWTWFWDRPSRIVEGTLISLAPMGLSTEATVSWRIIADPEGNAEVVQKGTARLTPGQRDLRAPIRIESMGRALAFEIKVEGDLANEVTCGWRDMRIFEVGNTPPEPPPPGLKFVTPVREHTLPDGSQIWLRTPTESGQPPPAGAWNTPVEAWARGPDHSGTWQVTFALEPLPNDRGVTPILMLFWYKSGRLEILNQLAAPAAQGEFTVEGWTSEGGGWLGVAVRPVSPGQPLNTSLRPLRWSK